jgi:hypothetical protein
LHLSFAAVVRNPSLDVAAHIYCQIITAMALELDVTKAINFAAVGLQVRAPLDRDF